MNPDACVPSKQFRVYVVDGDVRRELSEFENFVSACLEDGAQNIKSDLILRNCSDCSYSITPAPALFRLFSCMFLLFPDSRVRHLALYAKKARVRKKNMRRILHERI